MTQYFNAKTRSILLTHEGYTYLRQPKKRNKWKCYLYDCPGEAVTLQLKVLNVSLHNHVRNYEKIAAEFLKEKLVEWGIENCEIRYSRHLEAIYKCLTSEILKYLPVKRRILTLIINRRRRKGIRDNDEPRQGHFIFPMKEIEDQHVAEILIPCALKLNDYYLKNGMLPLPNPDVMDPPQLSSLFPFTLQQQQEQQFQIAESVNQNDAIQCNITSDKDMPQLMIYSSSNDIQESQYQESQQQQLQPSSESNIDVTAPSAVDAYTIASNIFKKPFSFEKEMADFQALQSKINEENNKFPPSKSMLSDSVYKNDGNATLGDAESPPILDKESVQFLDFDYCNDNTNNEGSFILNTGKYITAKLSALKLIVIYNYNN
uniref:FLYWCH-type domain-containing protein n=1 Tax=Panagrolaimus sp. ES5 TaxID=591445 RepID=A0AC34G0E6_9BILA